ncbi:MAG: uncharacterized protein KVP18_004147 [Porospora cf. gigantea A]|uniref:uncharacterized protein n=1 Tax=Porospora cf. gigantea A TaxID=2853593 RepID=UPI00355985A8|nr:MAG: hypothetical protein KVP18_004147 [Porospora cf. gigantea A]
MAAATTFCSHHLLAYDPRPLPTVDGERIDMEGAREQAQETCSAFLGHILALPRLTTDEGTFIVLAEHPTIKLPREMPALTEKPKTRWQKYAESKGIKLNKKREKLVWDEASKSWRPRHGRFSTKNNHQVAIVELKPQDEDNHDPFVDIENKKGKLTQRENFKRYRNKAERIQKRK